MEQLTGSKLRKEYDKAAYLTYTQSTSCEIPGWMKHKVESRLPGEISSENNLRQADNTTLMAESEEELKKPLDQSEVESEKLA